MKPFNLLFLIFLAIVSSASIAEDMTFDLDQAEIASLFDHQAADHILLIGFDDQHINRVQSVSPTTIYRRRGDYQSSTWSKRISTQIKDQYGLQKLTEWPMTEIGVHCAVYLVPAGESVEKIIVQLKQDKRINTVQKLHIFKTKVHEYNDPYFKLQTNLHDMQIDLAHDISTGRDVTIAMIDTGVDLDHPDLIGQIEVNKNFASVISSSFSNDKHGTAVAGILVAKTDNDTGIIGVAPNARLIALKACWPNQADSFAATCNSFTLALAINTAIKLGAKVLNMSLTGPQDSLLEKLLNKAMEKGMIIVASDTGSKNDKEQFPASLKNVISVQTLGIPYTNKKKKNQSIIIPGENILTTVPHGSYDFISGSSLSAAQVSGIVALLLELKPDMTLFEIKKILQKSVSATSTATKKGLSYGINANTAVLEICDEQQCRKKL